MGTINCTNALRKTFVVRIDEPQYPEHIRIIMGKRAPKTLHMMGNVNLLKIPGIGFCGARKASLKGLDTAKDCVREALKKDVAIISGNATGIDLAVHLNALKMGGKTILVLPEGINCFRIKSDLKSVWDWDRSLVISQFPPEHSWQTFQAMLRNQLIIALSRVMIVIEAAEKGGTMSTGKETLKARLPLFVAQYENMLDSARGNQLLLDMGAEKLGKNKKANTANFRRVFERLAEDNIAPKFAQQASLHMNMSLG